MKYCPYLAMHTAAGLRLIRPKGFGANEYVMLCCYVSRVTIGFSEVKLTIKEDIICFEVLHLLSNTHTATELSSGFCGWQKEEGGRTFCVVTKDLYLFATQIYSFVGNDDSLFKLADEWGQTGE